MTDCIRRAIKNRRGNDIGFYESIIPEYEDSDMKEYYESQKHKFKKKVK